MPVETFLVALTTFFATVGPADLTLVFAAITRSHTAAERSRIALRAILIATAILLFFAFFGEVMLRLFGITLPALRTAGGVLLLLMAIDMVFARHSGATSTTREEEREALTRDDISVFPLATPLIAGPGAISASILLIANAGGQLQEIAAVIAGLLAILALTYAMLMSAIPIQRLLGVTGLAVISRIVGVLLAALAVQFLFDGIASSGLLADPGPLADRG